MVSVLPTFTPVVIKKGPTITVIERRNNIFGGYSKQSWDSGKF